MQTHTKRNKNVSYLVILLSLAGLAISTYLSHEFISSAKEIHNCPLFGDGCSVVLHSEYSKFLGVIPNAYLGVLYYASLLFFYILYLLKKKEAILQIPMMLSIIGVLFSLYLLYVQGSLIGAFCFYCVSSALISILILIAEFPILNKIIFKNEIESTSSLPEENAQ